MASMLFGKFIGPRPNIDVVWSFTMKKWSLKGQVSVTAMAKGFLSFEFTCPEDMADIMCEGPWSLGRATLVLQKWSSKLDLNDSFFQQAPVWVKLLALPLEFWNEDVFKGVANSFGELLSIDPSTTSKSRLTYVRICVGVREGDDLPKVVFFQSKLGTHIQQLDHESIPFGYFHCLKMGHKAFQCSKEKSSQKKNPLSSSHTRVKKV